MKRVITSLLIFSAALICCLMPVSAASTLSESGGKNYSSVSDLSLPYQNADTDDSLRSENAYLKDEAGILSAESCRGLFDDILQTAGRINMNVAVYIGGVHRSDNTTEKFAEECSEYIFGSGGDVNSIFLYLDFEGDSVSYDYIDLFHDAKLYIKNSEAQDMIDDIDEYLPKSGDAVYPNQILRAVSVFLRDIEEEKDDGPDHNSCYYNEEINKYRYVFFGKIIESSIRPYRYLVLFLAASIIPAVIIAVLIGGMVRKKYKYREEQRASAYTSTNRVNYKDVKDILLSTNVTRQKIESSHRGGGGGGSSGGSGGSHGGAGGHR